MNTKNKVLKVNEIFKSVQGEGLFLGAQVTFIRLQGCPFRCSFCDTLSALDLETGTEVTVDEIIRIVRHFNTPRVVITGGEPLLQDIKFLLRRLYSFYNSRASIQIETNGSYPLVLPKIIPSKAVWKTVSPKPPKWEIKVVPDEIKLVVTENNEIPTEVLTRCQELTTFLWLQPDDNKENCIKKASKIQEKFPQFRIGLQAHKIWKVR